MAQFLSFSYCEQSFMFTIQGMVQLLKRENCFYSAIACCFKCKMPLQVGSELIHKHSTAGKCCQMLKLPNSSPGSSASILSSCLLVSWSFLPGRRSKKHGAIQVHTPLFLALSHGFVISQSETTESIFFHDPWLESFPF